MHFNPSIISDDGDDFGLPDDLSILAEQLTADADRLSAVYPVARQERIAVIVAGPQRVSHMSNLRRIAAVAAISTAVGIGGWAASAAMRGNHTPETIAAVPPTAADHDQQNTSSGAAISAHVADTAPAMSSGLFQDLSGAEKEAVLDLLEGDGNRPASLSI